MATILEISVAWQKRWGKLCHLISIQSTLFHSSTLSRKCQSSHFRLWHHCIPQVVTPIWLFVFSFPTIDAWSSPISCVYKLWRNSQPPQLWMMVNVKMMMSFLALHPEQPRGSKTDAATKPSTFLCFVASSSCDENCEPRNCSG